MLVLFAILTLTGAGSNTLLAAQPQPRGSILFDETLNEYGESRIGSGYAGLARELRSIGYAVDALTQGPITYEKLSQYDAFTIMAPFTPPRSLTTDEIDAIRRFVSAEGGLFMAAVGWSWVSYAKVDIASNPANQIGSVFGIVVNDDVIYDPTDNVGGPSAPTFHQFANHPVATGLHRIGIEGEPSSLSVRGDAKPVVWGDDDSYARSSATFTYRVGAHPPFAAAVEFGGGRVVYVGHDGIFHDRNLYKYDNLRFALNIFGWLVQTKRTTTVTLIQTVTDVTTEHSVSTLASASVALAAFAFLGGYLLARKRRNKHTVDDDTKIW